MTWKEAIEIQGSPIPFSINGKWYDCVTGKPWPVDDRYNGFILVLGVGVNAVFSTWIEETSGERAWKYEWDNSCQ